MTFDFYIRHAAKVDKCMVFVFPGGVIFDAAPPRGAGQKDPTPGFSPDGTHGTQVLGLDAGLIFDFHFFSRERARARARGGSVNLAVLARLQMVHYRPRSGPWALVCLLSGVKRTKINGPQNFRF